MQRSSHQPQRPCFWARHASREQAVRDRGWYWLLLIHMFALATPTLRECSRRSKWQRLKISPIPPSLPLPALNRERTLALDARVTALGRKYAFTRSSLEFASPRRSAPAAQSVNSGTLVRQLGAVVAKSRQSRPIGGGVPRIYLIQTQPTETWLAVRGSLRPLVSSALPTSS